MLEMTARELRDPVILLVLMETGNGLFHGRPGPEVFGA